MAGALLPGSPKARAADQPAMPKPSADDFRYCLNTSTIREQNIGIEAEIDLAAKLGYHGIEPWIRQLDQYEASGGSLSDLKKRIDDAGLTVDSAIGFARWIVDDEAERKAGLEQLKVDLDKLQQIGGTRIAAPPTGATRCRRSGTATGAPTRSARCAPREPSTSAAGVGLGCSR